MSGLLEKVISTSTIGSAPSGGGLLAPKQSTQFIDYMFDATTLGAQVRKVTMTANEIELDRMAIGERIVRLATEAVDDAVNVQVAFAKVSLTTEKLRLDWELSTEALEDNLEGADLEDHVARLMATQAANDIEDLSINGDVRLTDDSLYKAFDGWRKRLYAGAHIVDANKAELDRAVFNSGLRGMERKYMARRGALKWFTSAGLLQDYVYSAQFVEDPGTLRPAPVNPDSADQTATTAGWSPTAPFGIRAQEVPLFPEYEVSGDTCSDVWLVDPKNLVWGVKREIKVYNRFVPRKDTVEYTMYTRVGAAIENPNAAVLIKNVKYRD